MLFDGDIADNIDRIIAGYSIRITAGQHMRVAIQMLQHFPERKAAAELIKQNDGLSAVAIEGMGVAAHPVNIGIAVLFQNAPGFSNAGFAQR